MVGPRFVVATFSDDSDARFVDVTDSLGYNSVIRSNRTPRDATLVTIEPTAVNSNGTQYTKSDNLGSPRVITKSGGLVASRHDYMPFGTELGAGAGGRTTSMGFSNGGDTNRKKFTGYERDTATGLDFAQARYYSTTQGRFTSPDPLMASATAGDPQTWNRYGYVVSNPLKFVDPSGMIMGKSKEGEAGDISVYEGTQYHRGTIYGFTESDVAEYEAAQQQQKQAQKPQYPPVTADEVKVVYAGRAFESIQHELVNAIVDISNRQGCSDAFKEFNLTIPYDVVKSGKLLVASVAALYQDNAEQLLRLSAKEVSDSKAQFAKQGGLFGSGLFRTLTAERTYPSVPLAIFNPNVIRNPDFGIRNTVIHAFIHLGGQRGDRSATPHDLSNFRGYTSIIMACR